MNASSTMESLLADSVEAFLADHSGLHAVRQIEAGASAHGLWKGLLDNGYADALVPEAKGGSGLTLREVAPMLFACGRHLLPLPLAQTVAVRAALAERGIEAPSGPIAIAARASWRYDGSVEALDLPFGMTAQWVLVSDARSDWLLPAAASRREATRVPAGVTGDLVWQGLPEAALRWSRTDVAAGEPTDWRALGAALTAALIAGAMHRMCEMTIAYANERIQFGKPIGRQQAIQQQLGVLAELAAACHSAASLGLCPLEGSTWRADPLRCGVAKARSSEAVVEASGIAHAVHGAIGISEEYDLQMLTRHLHEWRLHYGSEGFWNGRVGAEVLRDDRTAARFIQQRVAPPSV